MAKKPVPITPEIEAHVLERLASGVSLNEICRGEGMPVESAIRQKTLKDPIFAAKYAQARETGYARMADELIEIADNGANDWMERNDPNNPGFELNGEHTQRSRLRLDTRKWLLSKCLPKIYGDKLEINGKLDVANRILEARRRVQPRAEQDNTDNADLL